MRPNRPIVLLLVPALLMLLPAACVPAPAAPPPVEALPAVTIEPTAAPTATVEPTAAPTATPPPSPTPAPTAALLTVEEILEGNAAANGALKTVQGTTVMEIEADGQTMSMVIEGIEERPDKEYAFTETMGQQIETVTLDGNQSFFIRQAGADVWIKMDAEQAGVTPQANLQISELAVSPQVEGEEFVDGVECYVIVYDINVARFFEADPRMAAFFDPLATTGNGKAWIGKEDLLTRRMELAMEMKGEALDLSMLIEATVGGFDEPVEFPEPYPYVELIALPVGDPVFEVAFSPDGKTLAACDDDMLIYLWDMADLAADPIMIDHPDVVKQEKEGGPAFFSADFYSLAFSPDGETLAAGSEGAIYLYDLADLEAEPVALPVEAETEGLGDNNVDAVAFSPDGKFLAAGGSALPVYVWSTADLTAAPVTLDAPEAEYMDLLFTPDGETLIYGGGEGEVLMWPMADLSAEPTVLTGHAGLVYSLDITSDGATLYTVGYEDPVRAWPLDRPDGRPEVLIPRQDEEIGKGPTLALALSPDEQMLATGDVPGSVRLWLLADTELPLIAPQGHGVYDVLSVAFSPDGKYLASGGGDAQVIVWALHLEE